MKNKIFSFAVLLTITSLIMSFGCGGGGVGGAAAGRTINLGGIVMVPTVSGNITTPKAFAKVAPNEGAASGVICTLYTLEGESLGNGETNSDGEFSVEVSLSGLKGAEDSGSTWSETVVASCDNGIELFTDVAVDEDSSEDIDLGTADSDTTLTAGTFAYNVDGFTGWGEEYKDALEDIDTSCLNNVISSMWDNSLLTESGIADDLGAIKEIIVAFMASSGSYEDLGYDSLPEMILAMFKGEVTEESWNNLSSAVADTLDANVDDLEAYFSTSGGAYAAVVDLLTAQFTEGAYGATNICGNINDQTLDPDALIKPLLIADDTSSFTDTYVTTDGIVFEFGLLETCATEEENACADMINKPAAFYGFINSYDEATIADVLVDGTPDSTALEGAYTAAAGCTGDTTEDLKACAAAVFETVYTAAGGDWSAFDAASLSNWAAYFSALAGEGSDVSAVDYQTIYDAYKDEIGSETVTECLDAAASDVGSCFGDMPPLANVPESLNDLTGYYHFDGTTDPTACDFDGAGNTLSLYHPPSPSETYWIYLDNDNVTSPETLVFSDFTEYDDTTGIIGYSNGYDVIIGQFYYTADKEDVGFIFMSGTWDGNVCTPGNGKVYFYDPDYTPYGD